MWLIKCSASLQPWLQSPGLHKSVVVAHIDHPNTLETKFKVILVYTSSWRDPISKAKIVGIYSYTYTHICIHKGRTVCLWWVCLSKDISLYSSV